MSLIDGRVYAGYGDYDNNTGPIHVMSVPATDPLGAWTDHGVADTEQLAAYRVLASGRIVSPHIDPRGAGGGYIERSPAGVWTDRPQRLGSTDVTHVFDMAEIGGDLYASGADGAGAAVWASADDGATWAKTLTGPRGEFARYYFLAGADGTLRVRDAATDEIQAWTGTAWAVDTVAPLPSHLNGGPGVPWRTGTVLLVDTAVGPEPMAVYYFDGTTSTLLAGNALGFCVGDDGALYLLWQRGIYRLPATGALTPQHVVSVASDIELCALCVLPGCAQALVGRVDSRVGLIDLP